MRFFTTLKTAPFLLLAAGIAGCATTAPARFEVRDVVADPQAYSNQRVELMGYVLDYQPPEGDTYRTLNFTLGVTSNEKLTVTAAGYTAASISKASKLLEQAYKNREPVTVVGKVKVESKEGFVSASELKLESVEYRGQKINVNQGPRSQPGFSVGGWYFTPSIGIGATITP